LRIYNIDTAAGPLFKANLKPTSVTSNKPEKLHSCRKHDTSQNVGMFGSSEDPSHELRRITLDLYREVPGVMKSGTRSESPAGDFR